jgi:hypothetical protein
MRPSPRKVALAARVGTWLGVFGWLIGFIVATLPYTYRFAPQIAGGLLLTAAVAMSLDWALRRGPLPPLTLWGALCLGVAAIGGYWNVAVEPAVRADPPTFARLVYLNSLGRGDAVTHFPPRGLAATTLVGLSLLAAAWLGQEAKRQRMR